MTFCEARSQTLAWIRLSSSRRRQVWSCVWISPRLLNARSRSAATGPARSPKLVDRSAGQQNADGRCRGRAEPVSPSSAVLLEDRRRACEIHEFADADSARPANFDHVKMSEPGRAPRQVRMAE